MTKSAHTQCDVCGRAMEKAERIANGLAYCGTCYKRLFVRKQCKECGAPVRAHKHDENPACRRCQAGARQCVRCDRPVARAGLRIGNKVACSACARYFREPKACPSCSRLSVRLSRAPHLGFPDPVCEHCRSSGFRTCAACGRFRAVFRTDQDGRALCKDCGAESPKTHTCPDCGGTVAGGGVAPCRECALKRRVEKRIRLNTELLEQDWVRQLFSGFCRWPELRTSAGDMTARIDAYAVFFRTLDIAFSGPMEITQEALFHCMGAEVLRRAFMPVKFIVLGLSLDWSAETLERLVEERRITEMVTAVRERRWYVDFERYRTWLVSLRAATAVRTVRMYLGAVLRLMATTSANTFSELDNRTIAAFLRRHKGHRASLTPFVRFLRESGVADLQLPPKARQDSCAFDAQLVQTTQRLFEGLRERESGPRQTALAAALLSKLYGVPLKSVLALPPDALVPGPNGTLTFTVEDGCYLIDSSVAMLLEPLINRRDPNRDLLFPGRAGIAPLTPAAVWHHIRQ